MVRAYYIWMKDAKDDLKWHTAIQYKGWEKRIKVVEPDATWDNDMFNALRKVQTEKGVSLKRGYSDVDGIDNPGQATKTPRTESTREGSALRGLIWDSKDYSCAYDSLFTVLYNIWTDAPRLWSGRFKSLTESLTMLCEGFHHVQNEIITIETARDTVRLLLNRLDEKEYPMGTTFTCIATLTNKMMMNREKSTSGSTCLRCEACGYKGRTILQISECFNLKNTGPLQDGRYEKGYISDCLGLTKFLTMNG
jgi:hypothetical protein